MLITIDIVGHVRSPHEPTLKEAATWTAFYVTLACSFGLYMYLVHGVDPSGEYFAGYITEYSLSIDNLFVFIIIIGSFKIPRKYQQKVLLYGIIIALVLRLIFIIVGAAIIERFVGIFFIFGLFLLYTAVQQLVPEGEDEEYKPNALVVFAQKHLRFKDTFETDKLLVKVEGKRAITPLFLCVAAIGSVDLMFALDSIPAVFGLTKEPFIVFSANAFALLGLRQLYFLIDGLMERLVFLHYGLAAILGFIAFKLILHAFHGYNLLKFIPEPSTAVSLGFIVVTVIITVLASVIASRGKKN